jgi:hypothetical protein
MFQRNKLSPSSGQMEAVCSSIMLVPSYQSTWHHSPKAHIMIEALTWNSHSELRSIPEYSVGVLTAFFSLVTGNVVFVCMKVPWLMAQQNSSWRRCLHLVPSPASARAGHTSSALLSSCYLPDQEWRTHDASRWNGELHLFTVWESGCVISWHAPNFMLIKILLIHIHTLAFNYLENSYISVPLIFS